MSTLTAYRLVKSTLAGSPFDGAGARRFGGRWNSKGRNAVYAAGSEALGLLEILVHIADPYELNDYRLFELSLPAAQVQRLGVEALPGNWRDDPPPFETASIGDDWLASASALALAVPSTVAIRDWNYLLNPAHAAFATTTDGARQLELNIDRRIYQRLG
ncbi:MAG: RES domain-containing protein [Salinisphaera sp.]|nr:RES domain-containing protein [Salinisphaera sp.]